MVSRLKAIACDDADWEIIAVPQVGMCRPREFRGMREEEWKVRLIDEKVP